MKTLYLGNGDTFQTDDGIATVKGFSNGTFDVEITRAVFNDDDVETEETSSETLTAEDIRQTVHRVTGKAYDSVAYRNTIQNDVRICVGADNDMIFVWLEDYLNERIRIVDWDLSDEAADDLVRKFLAGDLTDDDCQEDWEMKSDIDAWRSKTFNWFEVRRS